jgi:L,D-transpeptidase ErfK/SrfK
MGKILFSNRLSPVLGLLCTLLCAGAAAQQPSISSEVTGGEFEYTVRKGDSLTLVGARFGVGIGVLAEDNGLSRTAFLREGQTLRIENRHVVPQTLKDGIVVNVPQRMLFFFQSGQPAKAFPVAVGRKNWRTPLGTFRVLSKEENKVWHVPKSIQEEMRREGEIVKQEVPPGPENPLGPYWFRISPSCGIHATNFPASIYSFLTHGCIRLQPDAAAELYPLVQPGTPVAIIYEPMLFARVADECYLEVNRDVYGLKTPAVDSVRAWAASSGLEGAMDWSLVDKIIRSADGIARQVCRSSPDSATESGIFQLALTG